MIRTTTLLALLALFCLPALLPAQGKIGRRPKLTGATFQPPDKESRHLRLPLPDDAQLAAETQRKGRRSTLQEIRKRLIVLPDGTVELGPDPEAAAPRR